jgi:ornithine cyclodeaminase/alanine dehydrogenase-like protein (mu-crystallin family)
MSNGTLAAARRTSTANSTSTQAGSSISDMIGLIRSSGTVNATSATKSVRRDQPSYAVARRFQRVRRGPKDLTLFESAGIAYEDLVVARAALGRANRD